MTKDIRLTEEILLVGWLSVRFSFHLSFCLWGFRWYWALSSHICLCDSNYLHNCYIFLKKLDISRGWFTWNKVVWKKTCCGQRVDDTHRTRIGRPRERICGFVAGLLRRATKLLGMWRGILNVGNIVEKVSDSNMAMNLYIIVELTISYELSLEQAFNRIVYSNLQT